MGLLTTITRSSTRGRRSNLYLLHIGAKPDLSMRSARTVNLGEEAAQACQMLEEASGPNSLQIKQPVNLTGCRNRS